MDEQKEALMVVTKFYQLIREYLLSYAHMTGLYSDIVTLCSQYFEFPFTLTLTRELYVSPYSRSQGYFHSFLFCPLPLTVTPLKWRWRIVANPNRKPIDFGIQHYTKGGKVLRTHLIPSRIQRDYLNEFQCGLFFSRMGSTITFEVDSHTNSVLVTEVNGATHRLHGRFSKRKSKKNFLYKQQFYPYTMNLMNCSPYVQVFDERTIVVLESI
jgi:hypothetical protein